MYGQLAFLVGIYAFAGLPLWLTPVAHLAEWIRQAVRSLRGRSFVAGPLPHAEITTPAVATTQ